MKPRTRTLSAASRATALMRNTVKLIGWAECETTVQFLDEIDVLNAQLEDLRKRVDAEQQARESRSAVPDRCPVCNKQFAMPGHKYARWHKEWAALRCCEDHRLYEHPRTVNGDNSAWYKCCCGKKMYRREILQHIFSDFTHHRGLAGMLALVREGD